MEYSLDKFQCGLKKLKIDLSDYDLKKFLIYYEILIEGNITDGER